MRPKLVTNQGQGELNMLQKIRLIKSVFIISKRSSSRSRFKRSQGQGSFKQLSDAKVKVCSKVTTESCSIHRNPVSILDSCVIKHLLKSLLDEYKSNSFDLKLE